MKNETITRNDAILPTLQITNSSHRPSWKVFGTGISVAEFQMQGCGKYGEVLAIYCDEIPEGGKGAKRTMISISKEAALELVEMIHRGWPQPKA